MFEQIELAPADPILGLNEAFKKDKNPNKINLGVGVYKDEQGNTPILNSVKAAEKIILEEEITKNYLPIEGDPDYNKAVQELIFSFNHEIVKSKRATTVQAPGGTGALRIAADFLKKFFPNCQVWISNPTWVNHRKIFNSVGFKVNSYPYYDIKENSIDFDSLYKTVSQLDKNNIVIFHACCHNPTGMDLALPQWEKIASIAAKNGFITIFDMAYQGFGKGLDKDAEGILAFAKKVRNFFIASSFSKNFGLYNERVGALTVVTDNSEEAKRVLSQLKICIRTNFSNPPCHGAAIVKKILTTKDLRRVWEDEVSEMRNRISRMRKIFVENLKTKGCKRNFDFINQQQGMFSYTGLSKKEVLELREKFSIYFVDSGRINVAGINGDNIDLICKTFAKILN